MQDRGPTHGSPFSRRMTSDGRVNRRPRPEFDERVTGQAPFLMKTHHLPLVRLALIAAVLCPALARADVKLPAIFSDHMVLQRDEAAPVWGWADPGEKVTVSVAGQSQTAQPGADGKWTVKFTRLAAASQPATLTVKGKNTITIQDVLIGEVWLGSGQSNMAMTVNRAKDFEQEKAAANFPAIRLFREESGASAEPERMGKGTWQVCTPETVGSFSAVLYFFGREIHQTLKVPVGLINSSVGGTPIESWIAPDVQRASKELQALFAAEEQAAAANAPAAQKKYERDLAAWEKKAKQARAEKQKAPKKPQDPAVLAARKGNIGGLFNGKIVPLVPYGLRGMLWYQGEANSTPPKAGFYEAQLRLLVTDWRARWGREVPFAWAQLPNFGGPGRDWPTVREAMLKTLALPHTGMGINIDIGEEKNIHPTNKQEAGRRLSLWALGEVYGRKVPSTSGPLPAGHTVRGSDVVLRFTHADGGLQAKGGGLQGFVVAGEDRQWKPAQARIEGSTVIVSSAEVPKPAAVRYAWENFPTCNLYNGAGLPATPFRTDDWK
jgi:sialate O-acetylesterase